jgi:hypothetical protein
LSNVHSRRIIYLAAVLTGLAAALALFGQSGEGTFHAPEHYDLEKLYQQVKPQCPALKLSCFDGQFQTVTAKYGPRAAIELFTVLQQRGDIDANADGHHVAHHIGHHTAMVFGPSAEAFALCPASYNYGCEHGFFQHALGMGMLGSDDAAKICDNLQQDPSLPFKSKQSCYHGFGHGVMMFDDYDLHRALHECDGLNSPSAREACWQGVFMENIDAAEEGHWQKGLFSFEDPLAPCDELEEKYQYECFINHSAWLMRFFKNDLAKAAQACLKAPPAGKSPCLQTIGLLTTNRSWQKNLVASDDDKKDFFANAYALCLEFPEGYVDYCVLAGLDNLMNSSTVDVKRARDFCNTAYGGTRKECLERIEYNLTYLRPPRNAEAKAARKAETAKAPSSE